jgi:hypothetical protein
MPSDITSVYYSIKILASRLVDDKNAWPGNSTTGRDALTRKFYEHLLNLQDLEVSLAACTQEAVPLRNME